MSESGTAGDDRIAALSRSWQSAEDRLYPTVLVRPAAYASAVTLVRAVADRLEEFRTDGELADAFESAADVVADVIQDTDAVAQDLDLALVAGAAFNVRYREIRTTRQRDQAKRRIADAVARGDAWVVLFESGQVEFAVLTPYRRLEMRLADGFGWHASIAMNIESGAAEYSIERVQLDPVTGDWLPDAKPAEAVERFESRERWESSLTALRKQDSEL